jgi:hypothetical protein
MYILIVAVLLLGFILVLMLGLLSVFQDLTERNCRAEPVFDEIGPNFHDPVTDHGDSRSQFAWQSRSHGRGQD